MSVDRSTDKHREKDGTLTFVSHGGDINSIHVLDTSLIWRHGQDALGKGRRKGQPDTGKRLGQLRLDQSALIIYYINKTHIGEILALWIIAESSQGAAFLFTDPLNLCWRVIK